MFLDGKTAGLPTGKVVCVGRNYHEHVRELQNREGEDPVLFMKPTAALVPFQDPVQLPRHGHVCHFETEIAVLIGETLQDASPGQVLRAVAGYAGALDLTLRDVQTRLKQAGHPWELAKAFDRSCPITPFIRSDELAADVATGLRFSLHVNGVLRQEGHTLDMIWNPASLLTKISGYFTLYPGDVVLTGTPAGVGPLAPADRLALTIQDRYHFATQVAGISA
ncbi:MAG: fumarylacetoacetate hydrolase family protein [Magnetococcales bacterium]|nr:fumarylacetoacetate hydrolase family protein [Magnetococcales bacterium]